MYVPTWFVNDFQDWLAKDRNKSLGSIAPLMHKALSSSHVLSGASYNNNYTGLLEILEDLRVCYEKIVVYHHHQRRHIYISTTFLL